MKLHTLIEHNKKGKNGKIFKKSLKVKGVNLGYFVCNVLYQVCFYDAPGVKTDPVMGGHKFEHRNKERKLQNSSSLKPEGVKL